MAIEFWLTNERNTERVRLPVNPATITVSSPFEYNDVTIANFGEATIFGDRGLKEFSFETFFPARYNPVYCSYREFKAPYTYVAIIEKWRDSKLPIRLIVTGTKINYLVTIRDFSYEVERAGNPGDIYFSISFKQFRWISVRYEATRPPSTKSTQRIYTTVQNDILLHIARRIYGNDNKWIDIYNANKTKVKKHAYLVIKPGTKLVIP
jgi:hypothetical protein